MAEEATILDASVIVKWFSNKELTEEALKIREDHMDDKTEVFIPNLLLTEIANALRYNSDFNEKDVQEATNTIRPRATNLSTLS
jgi:predicted nucleic acid-binding protein